MFDASFVLGALLSFARYNSPTSERFQYHEVRCDGILSTMSNIDPMKRQTLLKLLADERAKDQPPTASK
jgi:hypothetical protein